MDNKKEVRISLSTIIVLIIVFVLLFIGFCLAISTGIRKNIEVANRDEQIQNLQDQVNRLNNTVDNITNETQKPVTTNKNATNGIEKNEVLYAIMGTEYQPSEDITYQYKFLDNKDELNKIVKIISEAKIYHQNSFIADFGDVPPIMTIYFTDSSPLHIMAMDEYNDDGNIVNLICIHYDADGSDKTIYEVDTEFARYIQRTFENTRSNNISYGKKIYGIIAQSNLSNEEFDYYDTKYLVIENDDIYFSNNLSDRIYECTYRENNDFTLNLTLKEDTEDYAFYTASIFKKEEINGLDYIRIENGESYILYELIK